MSEKEWIEKIGETETEFLFKLRYKQSTALRLIVVLLVLKVVSFGMEIYQFLQAGN